MSPIFHPTNQISHVVCDDISNRVELILSTNGFWVKEDEFWTQNDPLPLSDYNTDITAANIDILLYLLFNWD